MRIRAERDDLADAFTRAHRAVGTRSALPVLQGLKLEADGGLLTVTGTDLDMTIRTRVAVDMIEAGQVVIPGKILVEAVRKMPAGVVTISAEETSVEIGGNGPKFNLRPLTLEDFPQIEDGAIDGTEVDGATLTTAISQVTVAASNDAARPVLTGVKFESGENGLRMVATDSYRLAVRDLPGVGLGGSGLVPARALRVVERSLSGDKITVEIGDREAVFSSDLGTLRVRLIEGTFPKYQNLLPESLPNRIVLKKVDLLDALGRVSLVAEDHIPVRLTLRSGGADIFVNRQDVGDEREYISGEYTGTADEVAVAFNPRFLGDGVTAVPTDDIVIEVSDGMKPGIITGTGDTGFRYLLMPVRI